jgi:hypothetical protein
MEKNLAVIILDDEPIAFLRAEPLDPTMAAIPILDLLGARTAQLRGLNFLPLIGHLSLLFNSKDELLATFLAGYPGIAVIHVLELLKSVNNSFSLYVIRWSLSNDTAAHLPWAPMKGP